MKPFIKNLLFGGPGTATFAGDVGLAILRIGTGLLIGLGHGMSKVWGEGRFGPPSGFVEGVGELGFPAPTFFAWCAALTEFLGGLFLAAGLLTRPVALLLAFNMCVAVFGTHLHDKVVAEFGKPSKEPALLYLLPFVVFMLIGAGRYSVDRFIRGK